MRPLLALLVLALLAPPHGAQAQPAYPTRPIDIVVAFNAGGAADVAARMVAAYAGKKWGQNVNVVNMPGASGITGALQALRARPDGYTLYLDVHATASMLFAVQSDVPFKMEDKTPIALLTLDPVIYAVKADSPWKTLREVADAARTNPKAFRYGIAGVGAVGSFSVTQFLFAAGASLTETNKVVFTGGAPTVTALAGGHVDFVGQQWSESAGMIQGHKIRGLAVVHGTRRYTYRQLQEQELGVDVTVDHPLPPPVAPPAVGVEPSFVGRPVARLVLLDDPENLAEHRVAQDVRVLEQDLDLLVAALLG